MLTRSLIAMILLTAPLRMSAADIEPHDCSKFAPPHHIYKDASGHYFCARHRRPLIHGHVFSMPSPLPTIDFVGEMQRVSQCNPNSLYPYASLHHTKEFTEAGFYDYCPDCERTVLAAAARIEAEYRAHHH